MCLHRSKLLCSEYQNGSQEKRSSRFLSLVESRFYYGEYIFVISSVKVGRLLKRLAPSVDIALLSLLEVSPLGFLVVFDVLLCLEELPVLPMLFEQNHVASDSANQDSTLCIETIFLVDPVHGLVFPYLEAFFSNDALRNSNLLCMLRLLLPILLVSVDELADVTRRQCNNSTTLRYAYSSVTELHFQNVLVRDLLGIFLDDALYGIL